MSTDHNSFGHYPAFLCECATCTLTRELAEQARADRERAAASRLGRAIVNRAARDLDSVLTDPELDPGSRFTSRAPR